MTDYMENDLDFEQAVGEEFLGKVDRSLLRDDSEAGVVLLAKLCTICMLAAFTEYYRYPEKEEIIKESYKKALDVLHYGACKAPQNDQVEEKSR